MAHKNVTSHDANAPGKIDPSVISWGKLIPMVIDLWRWLGEHQSMTNRERALVPIHRDTAKREQEAVTQVNHQLLTQIKILQEAQQRVIELDAKKTQVDTSSEINQHPTTPTDLHFKLNKMRSKPLRIGTPRGFKSIAPGSVRGDITAQHSRKTLSWQRWRLRTLQSSPLKPPINQIFHIVKH